MAWLLLIVLNIHSVDLTLVWFHVIQYYFSFSYLIFCVISYWYSIFVLLGQSFIEKLCLTIVNNYLVCLKIDHANLISSSIMIVVCILCILIYHAIKYFIAFFFEGKIWEFDAQSHFMMWEFVTYVINTLLLMVHWWIDIFSVLKIRSPHYLVTLTMARNCLLY